MFGLPGNRTILISQQKEQRVLPHAEDRVGPTLKRTRALPRNPSVARGYHHQEVPQTPPTNVQRWKKTYTPAAPTSPKCASAWQDPAPRAPAKTWRAHQQLGPAGVAPGFRSEARRSPFGSGSGPALTREPSRSLNIRDQRLVTARISGNERKGRDPVTPLPVCPAAQALALGSPSPSPMSGNSLRPSPEAAAGTMLLIQPVEL
ncbi:uncharacterized protein LOC117096357 [Trachypithecus francoisi]|uniref:uncharacterized protein LOC117096357 n=1 Tax=Trachypithecus francoisi TaxID=54180 RepID=UPI00141B08D6|nr:uncharacterized protein LOC117096357 [Trachypithecus francoisi]